MKSENFSEVYRHSMAHILAKAMVEILAKKMSSLLLDHRLMMGFIMIFCFPEPLHLRIFLLLKIK